MPTILETERYGREIKVVIDDKTDQYGQFRVTLFVGGYERYAAYFTDKSEDNDS